MEHKFEMKAEYFNKIYCEMIFNLHDHVLRYNYLSRQTIIQQSCDYRIPRPRDASHSGLQNPQPPHAEGRDSSD